MQVSKHPTLHTNVFIISGSVYVYESESGNSQVKALYDATLIYVEKVLDDFWYLLFSNNMNTSARCEGTLTTGAAPHVNSGKHINCTPSTKSE